MLESDVASEPVRLKTNPRRIGLISDTHVPRDAKMLPPHVKEAFRGVDLILHAGDIYLPEILDELGTIAPVLAARGNGDREWDFPDDNPLRENLVLDLGGLRLGLTHAVDYAWGPENTFRITVERRFGSHLDIIVSGDTHVAMAKRYDGILLVNPGSPTLPNGLFELGTVALLEIDGNKAEARIVPLSELPLPFDRQSIYYRGAGA